MTRKYLSYLFAALLAINLGGCKEQLGELDTTAGLNMALSIPFGSFSLSMNDLLGENAPNLIVDEEGMFHIKDTTVVAPKAFHAIDLTDYFILTEGGKHFKVLDQLSSKINPAWLSFGVITSPKDTTIPLTFEMSMKLKGFNVDMDSERIDSIWVALAEFSSMVNKSSDFGINWSNIGGITLKMGDRIVRHQIASNEVVIPIGSYDFGSTIPIIIDDFTVNLVDKTGSTPLGLVDSVKIEVIFDLELHAFEPISITAESDFVYDLSIDLLNYDAVWGYFKESREMYDHNAISLDSLWRNWKDIKNMKLRFARPSLTFYMDHHIGAPLKTHVDYMYSYNAEKDEKIFAKWNGQTETDLIIENVLDPTDPKYADLNSKVRIELPFSYREDQGHIDLLFHNIPDSFCYAYHVMVDEGRKARYPQHRLTSNLDFTANEVLDLPFYFENGTSFRCEQNMQGLKLSSLQLDSMLQKANINAQTTRNDLTLYIAAENYVPFEVDVVMECLDKDSNLIVGPDGKPLISFFEGDTLRVPAPAAADMVDGKAVKPSQLISTRVLHKKDFDNMAQVAQVHLVAIIGKNAAPAKVTTDTKLTMRIGVTAEVEGTLNFDKLFKK